MQAKEIKKEELTVQYEVTVTAQDIERHVDDRLKEVGKTAKMAGFRPGKVPMDILKKRYGKSIMGEVLEMAVNEASAKVIQDNNLRPALQPKIEVKEFEDGKDLIYTMAIELLPDFKVIDLKSVKVEKPVAKIEKKQVDEAIERIAKGNRETEPVTEDRASKKGDILVIDFHGRTAKDNKPHAGMQAHDSQLELGSGQFIPGFEEQLTGKKVGDKVEVKVTFPEQYHAAELAGQEAIFDTEVKAILQAKATEINDDFAKKLGLDSEKALRDIIEGQMQSEYNNLSRQKVKRALLDTLDDAHEFEIPAGMKDLEYQNILMQVKMERQADLKDGELKLTDEEEEELHAIAERRVRLGLVLSEVGRANNVQITDQEMQRAVINEAQRYPGQEAQVFEYYRKNRQALEALRAPVFEDKVVDFVLELATVTEKSVTIEELRKEEEEESYLEKRKAKGGSAKPKAEKKKA